MAEARPDRERLIAANHPPHPPACIRRNATYMSSGLESALHGRSAVRYPLVSLRGRQTVLVFPYHEVTKAIELFILSHGG